MDLGEEERGKRGQTIRERKKRANRKREGKCGIFRERSSTSSLEFSAIGPVNSDEARSKVAPHSKDYAWVPILRGFEKLRKGRVFSPTCFTFCLRVM